VQSTRQGPGEATTTKLAKPATWSTSTLRFRSRTGPAQNSLSIYQSSPLCSSLGSKRIEGETSHRAETCAKYSRRNDPSTSCAKHSWIAGGQNTNDQQVAGHCQRCMCTVAFYPYESTEWSKGAHLLTRDHHLREDHQRSPVSTPSWIHHECIYGEISSGWWESVDPANIDSVFLSTKHGTIPTYSNT
jgi:hypothetical protein